MATLGSKKGPRKRAMVNMYLKNLFPQSQSDPEGAFKSQWTTWATPEGSKGF